MLRDAQQKKKSAAVTRVDGDSSCVQYSGMVIKVGKLWVARQGLEELIGEGGWKGEDCYVMPLNSSS